MAERSASFRLVRGRAWAALKASLPRVRDGAAAVGLVFFLAAAERLADAASTLEALKTATSTPDPAPDWPKWFWLIVIVAGAWLAWRVLKRLHATVEAMRAQQVVRERESVPRPDPHAADAQALRAFGVIAIVSWVFWQVLYAYPLYWGSGVGPAKYLHWIAIGAAILALGAGGRAIGDPSLAWRRASVARLHLILLGVLLAVFFLVPVTSAQVNDVLRAWGDGPLSRVAYGVAAAVLLGAVVRASAHRLFVPTDWKERWDTITVVAIVAGVALALLLWLVADALLGAGAVVVILVVSWLTSEWTAPECADPGSEAESRLKRLAGTLSVLPVGILFAGLAAALMDTLLLPSPASTEDVWLIGATVLVGVVLTGLVAFAHPPERQEPKPPEPRAEEAKQPTGRERPQWLAPAALAGIAVLGFALALVTAGGDTPGDVASIALLIGACALTSWWVGERGAPQFFAAAGVVTGTAIAVYTEPVAAPRELGALGVGLVGAAGMLLVLHLAGTLGARRALAGPFAKPWLPTYLPVVGLLAVWVVAAWATVPDTFHQARTIGAERAPVPLADKVHDWLDRQTAQSPGERVPMLMVAASGGGAKAAYWTDLVLDCLAADEPPNAADEECPAPAADRSQRLQRLFLTSSVSGGSVGIYHYLRHRPKAQSGQEWVFTAAGEEVLSPMVAWGLFHDLPAFMVGADVDPTRCTDDAGECLWHGDRALAQEAAVAGFEDGLLPSEPSTLLGAPENDRPVTVFNAALDGADGRVLMSPVSVSPPRVAGCATPWTGEPGAGSMDGHDMLNTQPGTGTGPLTFTAEEPYRDIPLVTSALLSARFPVVAPAGRLGTTAVGEGVRGCEQPPDTLPPATLRDGGYMENSGLLTVTEMLPAIRAAIESWEPPAGGERPAEVPIIVVSVDDDPVLVGGDPELGRTPRSTLGISKRSGPGYFTRLARDRLESCQYPGVHYVRISPAPHVGAAAATGWEVSATARREDLIAALANAGPGEATGDEAADAERREDAGVRLQQVRELLDAPGDISCPA